jgi:uncharacterized membrane protein YccC
MYGPMAACLSELFGTRVRYTGASLAYQLTSVFSGGVAPLISTYLLARYGSGAVAAYIAGCCAITLIAASLAPETHRTDLDDARRRHRRDRRSPRVSNSCDAGGAEQHRGGAFNRAARLQESPCRPKRQVRSTSYSSATIPDFS